MSIIYYNFYVNITNKPKTQKLNPPTEHFDNKKKFTKKRRFKYGSIQLLTGSQFCN